MSSYLTNVKSNNDSIPFEKIPTCSVVPVNDADLCNKLYVDSQSGGTVFERVIVPGATGISNTIETTMIQSNPYWSALASTGDGNSGYTAIPFGGWGSINTSYWATDTNNSVVSSGAYLKAPITIENENGTVYGTRGSNTGVTGIGNALVTQYSISGNVEWASRIISPNIHGCYAEDVSINRTDNSVYSIININVYNIASYNNPDVYYYNGDDTLYLNDTPSNIVAEKSGALVKYDSNGNIQWRSLTAKAFEAGMWNPRCDVNSSGSSVLMEGYQEIEFYNSTDSGSPPIDASYTGQIASYNNSGVLQWGIRYTRSNFDSEVTFNDVTIDNSGNVYFVASVIGYGSSTITLLNSDNSTYDTINVVTDDQFAIVGKYNSSGIGQWGTIIQNSINVLDNAETFLYYDSRIAVDRSDGSIYVAMNNILSSETYSVSIQDITGEKVDAGTALGIYLVHYNSSGAYIEYAQVSSTDYISNINNVQVNTSGQVSLSLVSVDPSTVPLTITDFTTGTTTPAAGTVPPPASTIGPNGNGVTELFDGAINIRYTSGTPDFYVLSNASNQGEYPMAGSITSNGSLTIAPTQYSDVSAGDALTIKGYTTASGTSSIDYETIPSFSSGSMRISQIYASESSSANLSLADATTDGFIKNINMVGNGTVTLTPTSSILNYGGTSSSSLDFTDGNSVSLIWDNNSSMWNTLNNDISVNTPNPYVYAYFNNGNSTLTSGVERSIPFSTTVGLVDIGVTLTTDPASSSTFTINTAGNYKIQPCIIANAQGLFTITIRVNSSTDYSISSTSATATVARNTVTPFIVLPLSVNDTFEVRCLSTTGAGFIVTSAGYRSSIEVKKLPD